MENKLLDPFKRSKAIDIRKAKFDHVTENDVYNLHHNLKHNNFLDPRKKVQVKLTKTMAGDSFGLNKKDIEDGVDLKWSQANLNVTSHLIPTHVIDHNIQKDPQNIIKENPVDSFQQIRNFKTGIM